MVKTSRLSGKKANQNSGCPHIYDYPVPYSGFWQTGAYNLH
jgi:hypothetical protein